MKIKFHDFLTLLTSTEKLLTQRDLNPHLREHRSAALPVELLSYWEPRAHLIQLTF